MEKNFVVEDYLDKAKGKKIRVIIQNGYQMKGVLKTFDDKAILLKDVDDGELKLVFLRQISTITP